MSTLLLTGRDSGSASAPVLMPAEGLPTIEQRVINLGRDSSRDAAEQAMLVVHSTDIHFESRGPRRVLVDVTIANHGGSASLPVEARIGSALLGAFLEWSPLETRRIPSIRAGGAYALTFEAEYVPPTLPFMNRVTPCGLHTALEMFDQQRPLRPTLATNLMDVIGRPGDHWAGNLNIMLEGRPAAERHLAAAVRMAPGRNNVAMFIVGTVQDDYAFAVSGRGVEWRPELRLMNDAQEIRECAHDNDPIDERQWIRLQGGSVILLRFTPPADAMHGRLIVHVQQRSTGRSTQVEFSLDAHARGAGCYVLE